MFSASPLPLLCRLQHRGNFFKSQVNLLRHHYKSRANRPEMFFASLFFFFFSVKWAQQYSNYFANAQQIFEGCLRPWGLSLLPAPWSCRKEGTSLDYTCQENAFFIRVGQAPAMILQDKKRYLVLFTLHHSSAYTEPSRADRSSAMATCKGLCRTCPQEQHFPLQPLVDWRCSPTMHIPSSNNLVKPWELWSVVSPSPLSIWCL